MEEFINPKDEMDGIMFTSSIKGSVRQILGFQIFSGQQVALYGIDG